MKNSTMIKGFMLLIVVGVSLGILLGLFVNSLKFKGWEEIQITNAPLPRYLSAAAYNKSGDYALLFGGAYGELVNANWQLGWLSDTWKWDGSKWEQLQPKNSPSPREKHAMAYDEERDVIVMFGGSSNGNVFNDTWEWNGEDWIEIEPQHIPTSRCCHTMAYDPIRKGIILYAGWNGKDTFWSDTWLWDGKDWTRLPYPSPQMSGHVLVQYPIDKTLISMQTADQGTWSLLSDGWQDLDIFSPPSRSDGRADYGEDKIIYFGGSRDSIYLNDTWMYINGVWFQLKLSNNPLIRFGHVLFYDEIRESFIMFGGANSTQYLNDTWELNLPDKISDIPIESIP